MTVQDKYDLLKQSVLEKKRVQATYHGRPRVFCVMKLGYSGRVPHSFAWQFGGESGEPLPNYRCFLVDELQELSLHDGWEWPTRLDERAGQHCVQLVQFEPDDDGPNEGSLDS